MRGPAKAFWQAHYVPGSAQIQRHPTRVTFLVILSEPEKEKGRHVELTFTHAVLLSELASDALEALENYGGDLPDTMG